MGVTINFCPDCSRELSFASPASHYIICNSCGSVNYRDQAGVVSVKPRFVISEKTDLLQPGSTGTWKDRTFTVTGRFRAWFDESVFNYWTIVYQSGETAWLGEGYGIYCVMVPFNHSDELDQVLLEKIKIYDRKKFSDESNYVLHKKLHTLKYELEGEVVLPSAENSFRLFEFSSATDKHLHVLSFGDTGAQAFAVEYGTFESFAFSNLNMALPGPENFECSSCHKEISVKTFPYAQSCVCPQCELVYVFKDGHTFESGTKIKNEHIPWLELGRTGVIHGHSFEIIGFTVKREQNIGGAEWSEYTLYNRELGFRFLSQYEGHWIFIKEERNSPVLEEDDVEEFEFHREPFLLFNTYTYRIITAMGEFPNDIFDFHSKTKVKEFISPPELWIYERNQMDGITWFYGEHMPVKELQTAFAADRMPERKGIGAVQPTGYLQPMKYVAAGFAGLLLILLVHGLFTLSLQHRVILDRMFRFTDSTDQISFVTPRFTLDKWRGNLQFSVSSPVFNNWFEFGATLVDADNGKEYSLEKGVEYYSGYSEGEHWSEGSTEQDVYLSSIPAGNYYLQLSGTRESNVAGKTPYFGLVVRYDVSNERNAFWPMGILLVFLIGKYLTGQNRERKRWNNSPYSTFE